MARGWGRILWAGLTGWAVGEAQLLAGADGKPDSIKEQGKSPWVIPTLRGWTVVMEGAVLATTDEADQFRQLQAQLRDRWQVIELFDNRDNDILVIPSLSLDQRELQKVTGAIAYEERLLFSLIRLKNPRSRVVYVTSAPLSSIVINY